MKNELPEKLILPDEREYPRALTEQYELLECFSDRDTSRTLLARERGTGALCVVKCFFRGSPLYDRSEPEELKELQDAPFPRFLGEYKGEQMRCVVRSYIHGTPLSETMEKTAWTPGEVIRIGAALCDQLTVLHSLPVPVIHRDIKPQNVIMDKEGNPVLIDFGISRTASDASQDTMISGTAGYAPPEQYGFAQTDSRADIYALGVMLHQMVKQGGFAKEKRHPSKLERVISKCCEFDPERRYKSAAKLKQALLDADPGADRKRTHIRIAAAACAAVLIAAACLFGISKRNASFRFAEPLIEQAVRLNLGLSGKDKIGRRELAAVKALYIVADTAYPDPDSFYEAVNRWYGYAPEERVRGEITSLEDLEQMKSLEEVCVVIQEIDDIHVLSGLENLTKIELKHNRITDISPVSDLGHITSVGLNDNPVHDISPLLKCPDLAFLDLCDVNDYDPAVIAELGSFQYLDISNSTDSWRYLTGKSIHMLRVGWTDMDDLSALDGVSALENLQMEHAAVTDLTPLLKHTGLRQLNIAGVWVRDLGVLKELPQLEEVTVSEGLLGLVEKLGEIPFEVKTGW